MIKKEIYLLIGQKGSGKTFIGTLMERNFGIKFIRVEDWVKELKKGRDVFDKSYIAEVFNVIEAGIRDSLKRTDRIVFESTGVTDQFDQMLANIRKDFSVTTIGVNADHLICLDRVRTRDQSIHINVSDEQVEAINKKVRNKEFQTDFSIINQDRTENELVDELRFILAPTS